MIASKAFCRVSQTNHKGSQSNFKLIITIICYHIRQQQHLLHICRTYLYSLNYHKVSSPECRNNQYQRTHVKSVPEKWIKSQIVSLSHTKKVGSLIHLGQVKLIVSVSLSSIPTLTVNVGLVSMSPLVGRVLATIEWQNMTTLPVCGPKCFINLIMKSQQLSLV